MSKKLPKNWIETELENLFNLTYGKGLSVNNLTDNGYDVYGANGVIGKYSKYLYLLPKVIISCRGAASGAIHLTKEKSYITSNSIVLDEVDRNLLNLSFVKYAMITLDKSSIITGTAQPQITIQLLKNLKFPLPPLSEQNRIAAKLDVFFEQLGTMKLSLAKTPKLLKDLQQKVLNQAITGKLTEKWREDKNIKNEFAYRKVNENLREINYKIPKTWIIASFDSVVTINSNLVSPNDYLDYPLIAPDNIESESGRLLSKPFTSDIMPISPKHYFEAGSILYSKIRPYLSKLVLVDFDGLCSADMYPLSTDLNIKYLFYYMLSNDFLSYATTAGERSVLPKINQKGLGIIPIPVPPLQEQAEIVSIIDNIFIQLDAIEQQHKALREKIDSLPNSILHKAFKGELTKQIDTDGNAQNILDQINVLKLKSKTL